MLRRLALPLLLAGSLAAAPVAAADDPFFSEQVGTIETNEDYAPQDEYQGEFEVGLPNVGVLELLVLAVLLSVTS